MSNINDLKILELKKKIEKEKELMSKVSPRFNPVTSCMLELDGVKYNLNVMKQSELILLHLKLHNLYKAAVELNVILDEIKISGFKLMQWTEDISCKIGNLRHKEDKKNLDEMESKLDKLLSEEKKAELEIDAISSMLNI